MKRGTMRKVQINRRLSASILAVFILAVTSCFVLKPFGAVLVSAVTIGNLGDYFQGVGSTSGSAFNYPDYIIDIDYVHSRIRWVEVEPSYRSMNWSVIDSKIANLNGNKLILGVMLKQYYAGGGCAYWNGGLPGDRTSPGCYDGTPAWIVQSQYNPIWYAGVPMVNYANAAVQTELTWMIEQLTARYNSNSDIIWVFLPGVDGENAPEKGPAEDAYEIVWGAGARGTWVDYVKGLADVWQTNADGHPRLMNDGLHFIDTDERKEILDHVFGLSEEWGLYSMTIEAGFGFAAYRFWHDWNEFDEVGYGEEEDLHRNVCRTRPCYAEHAGNITGSPATEGYQFYKHASALWQRMDGYGTLRTWMYGKSWADGVWNFFNAYAGKTGNTADVAWTVLREDYAPGVDARQKVKNYYQFMDQVNVSPGGGQCDGTTDPVWTFSQSGEYWDAIAGETAEADFRSVFARKVSNCAYFDVDPQGEQFWQAHEEVTIDVVYLDYYEGVGGVVSDTLSLEYYNGAGIVTAWTETKTEPSAGTWVTKSVTLPLFQANGGVGGYDFRINSNGDGAEYIHQVILTKTGGASGETPTPTPTGAVATPTNTPTAQPPFAMRRLGAPQSGNAKYTYVYDTGDDYRSNGWINSTLSWYTEPLSTTNRGFFANAPEIMMLEAQANKLVIFDPGAYNIPQETMTGKWMQIQQGTDNAVGPTTNNTINSVFAHDGFVCVGLTGTASYGVVCADFPNDTFHRWDTGGYYDTTSTISQRHRTVTYSLADAGAALHNDQVNDLYMEVLDDGDLYIMVGSDDGFDEINVTDSTVRHFDYGTRKVGNIAIASDGAVFSQQHGTEWANLFNYIDDIRDEAAGSWNVTKYFYSAQYIPRTAQRATYGTGVTEVLFGERSPLDADTWTVYLADGLGVTVLYLDDSDLENSAVRFIANDFASEEMRGDVRGYWGWDDTSTRLYTKAASVYDSVVYGAATNFDLTETAGTALYSDGARNDALYLDGSTYLEYAPTEWLEYDETNYNNAATLAHSGASDQVAQEFTSPDGEELAEVWLYMVRTGTPGGNVCVTVETDAAGLPSGTPVDDVSTCIATGDINTTASWVSFQWLGTKTKPDPASATVYHLVVSTDAGYTYSAGVDLIQWYGDTSSPTFSSGEMEWWNGAAWFNSGGTWDMIFKVYDQTEAFIVDNATGTDGFSISAWITTTTESAQMIAGRSNWSHSGWLFYLDADGDLVLGGSGGGSITASSDTITNGSWAHVVGVYGVGSNNSHIYIDGASVATGTLTVDPSSALFRIGVSEAWDGSLKTASAFIGSIDELMITNETLSSSDVTRMYHRGQGAVAWEGDHFAGDVSSTTPVGLGYMKGDQELVIAMDTGGGVSLYDLNHDRQMDFYDDTTVETDYWEGTMTSANDLYGSASSARGQRMFAFEKTTGNWRTWQEGTWPFPTATPTPFPVSASTIVTYIQGVNGYSSMVDAHLQYDNPDTAYGLNHNLVMRSNATNDDQNPILILFDDLALPSGITIDNAYLTLYTLDSSSAPPAGDVDALFILKTWEEAEVTWNDRNGTPTPWASGGLHNVADADLTPFATAPAWNATPDQTRQIDIGAAIQKIVDGTPVYGVKLQFDDTTSRNYFAYGSRHNVDSGKRPYLEVHYSQTYQTPTPTPTWTHTPTPTPTGMIPTNTPTAILTPTPTHTSTPGAFLKLNEIVYDPEYDINGDFETDKWDECIGLVWGGSSVQDISDYKIVTVIDSGRFTYTIPFGAAIFPGEKAYTRLDTSLPLTYTATIREVYLYDTALIELDSKSFSNALPTPPATLKFSDKRIPDLGGSWTNTTGQNCGEQNTQPTRTPTPTASPTPA